ncbi:MurR/RpiR family transcriptional regulator [Paenibacillus chitinolyticus]|uniref:MurR/RpiR family transcriptional regulator n=1 Tax=Paenibacillus chitinolyticus TaxID=79263 RepID=A0A410X083_9BACL|nr:MurR/RpiR family transcriptional regulator [Paenibacillus chitinolyticus]MCY9592859.1 MurR/RpiR family transcriptional regulator [Paenibacillus chitinolyticus]MCY9595948.1 MurR/RpiR family transcriptional regulator [Paenibacillus chitinolyticus]MEC0246186.1 MurR/RpiR family transcriptional regulator [Paenibacillus chitinolyticus]QAV19987.1 MurR/RpiR family transcriptional regulator [Paenibacillus chitinolyticus]
MSKIADLNNSLLLLNSIYSSLTKSEQKVADTVLKDPEATVFYTITDLAEKAEVGETSVIRLCRKLGYKGYQEFKLSLVQVLATPSEQVHGKIEESDDLDQIMKKMTSQNSQAVQNSTSLLNVQELQQAIDAILAARKILFFGVGSSGITAQDAKYRFMRLGFNVDAGSDGHIIAMNASLVEKGDVVVGISSSGSTKDLVDAVRLAKQKGAYIICLTNHARSPIANQSNVVLLATAKETPLQGGAFSSKLAQIHLLDILSTAVAMQMKDQTYRALEHTAKSVLDKLY